MNIGIVYALIAFVMWGLFPVYWKQLAHVDAVEILAHRMLWSVPFLALVLAFSRQWRVMAGALRNPAVIGILTLTASLITINWGVYIWAVNNNQVIEGSLGYFLSPLFSVLLGWMFFGERLGPLRTTAIAIITAGVALKTFAVGFLPWVSLVLGLSFAAYGALRKKTSIESIQGLFVETVILLPFALVFLFFLVQGGGGDPHVWQGWTPLLLVLGGAVTATPLIFYVAAARRLHLSTVGIMFYITPTLQFVFGALVYNEPVSSMEWIAFSLIWAGLVLFTLIRPPRSSTTSASPERE